MNSKAEKHAFLLLKGQFFLTNLYNLHLVFNCKGLDRRSFDLFFLILFWRNCNNIVQQIFFTFLTLIELTSLGRIIEFAGLGRLFLFFIIIRVSF